MNWLINLLTFDWELKETYKAEWRAYWEDLKYTSTEGVCWYEIYYSKKRNRFKIKMGGYKPKYHKMYSYVVKIANSYINKKL